MTWRRDLTGDRIALTGFDPDLARQVKESDSGRVFHPDPVQPSNPGRFTPAMKTRT